MKYKLTPSELSVALTLLFLFCLFIGSTTINFSTGEFYMEHYILSPLFAMLGVWYFLRYSQN